MRRRVVCGLSETIATLPPASAFTSVDLPTLGRPATATKPLLIAALGLCREPGAHERTPPIQGWGCRPATHSSERTVLQRTRLCQCRADSSRGQVPGLRQKLSRRVSDDPA